MENDKWSIFSKIFYCLIFGVSSIVSVSYTHLEAWDGKKIRVSEGNYRNPYYNDTNMMVAYARTHAEELVHEETYNSYEEYKKRQADIGLVVVGFIYEKQ